MNRIILFGLIYRKDITFLIELYKPYDIIKYIDHNYVDNLKNHKSIINDYSFINRAVIR